jgi:inhibitor of KinA
MHFAPLGDHAITISLGESIDERTHRLVRAVSALLDARPPQGLIDQVPAFVSVAVHYDPAMVPGDTSASPYQRMVSLLEHALRGVRPDELEPARVIDIPVCYGGAFGPDLDDVAQQHDLRAGEVVEIHAGCEYLSDRIATPRRASPRALVPGGTVGIGGQQTGVYPLESPGGWNLIGRTPLRIFDISRDQAALLATGDRVRFRPITPAEFESNPGTS